MAQQLDLPAEKLDLSPRERRALEEFCAEVRELPAKPDDSDCYYLRWLRARKYDVQKAVKMFRNHLDYRAKYGADTIIQDWTPPEVLTKCFPGGFFGEDREGHPVWYDCMGNLDFRGLHRSAAKEDILKLKCLHAAQCDVLLKKVSAEKGRQVETITSIVDFENLSLNRHYYLPGLEMLKQVLADVEANCPERIQYVFVVKAPAIFPICYNIVKHIFDEKTHKKIFVLGDNWKEELQKYISPDQMPEAYGGTCCDPDPWCSTSTRPGCDVPPEYYFTNLTETSREEMQRVLIGRGSCFKVRLEVTQVGSHLCWEFVSNSYDIAFGVSVVTDGRKQEVIPMSRCDSHLLPQAGKHCCSHPGQYTLKFDNSFSWTRAKELFYSMTVEPRTVTKET